MVEVIKRGSCIFAFSLESVMLPQTSVAQQIWTAIGHISYCRAREKTMVACLTEA